MILPLPITIGYGLGTSSPTVFLSTVLPQAIGNISVVAYQGERCIRSYPRYRLGGRIPQSGDVILVNDANPDSWIIVSGRTGDLVRALNIAGVKDSLINAVSASSETKAFLSDRKGNVYTASLKTGVASHVLSVRELQKLTALKAPDIYSIAADPSGSLLALGLPSEKVFDRGSAQDPMIECWTVDLERKRATAVGFGDPIGWLSSQSVVAAGFDMRPDGPSPFRVWVNSPSARRTGRVLDTGSHYAAVAGSSVFVGRPGGNRDMDIWKVASPGKRERYTRIPAMGEFLIGN